MGLKCGIDGNDDIVTRCFQKTFWVVTFAYDIPDEGYGVGGFKKGSQLRTHRPPYWKGNRIAYMTGNHGESAWLNNLSDHKVEKIVIETIEREHVTERTVVQSD
jgi:hypothetical protein